MEAIRKFFNADSPMPIMAAPEAFMNRKPKSIVFPTDGQASTDGKRDVPSIVQSLVGAIPHTELSLDELREERRGKYKIVH